jgi:threonine dehydrogenase-like Zn-dependent dehydrogenase
VRDLPEGSLAAVDPSLFCGHCRFCRRGRGNLCANWNAIGDTVDGAFAEYVAVPAHNVYLVGDALCAPEAAMIEPVSCAVHALDRITVSPGDDILVYGAGSMGLILGQLLRRAGGTRVHVVDLNADRLPGAEKLFADAIATSADAFDLDGYDLVVDVTGAIPAIEDGFSRVRRGGTLLVFGVADAGRTAALSPFRIYNDEINVVGSMAVCNSFGKARDLVLGGIVDVGSVVTAVRPLEEYDEAIASVRAGEGVKTLLSPTGVTV